MGKLSVAQNEKINNEVVSETIKAFKKAGWTIPAIAKELALIGFADMADFVTISESGIVQAIPFDELAKGKSRIIKKVKEKRVIRTEKGTKDKPDGDEILDATFEFELYSKLDAIQMAGDVLGMKAPTQIKADLNHQGSVMAAVANLLSNPVKATKEDKAKTKKIKPKSK
jgi:hypothetical protein